MIDKKYAVEQIKRFKILNFFPTDSVGLNELAMALMVADTEQIAKQVVDDLMTEFTDCPKPAQIRIAAYARNEAVERASSPKTPEDQWGPIGPLCGLCASWGWIVRDNVASRCTCENGQALDQKLLDLLNEHLRSPRPTGHRRLQIRRVSEENLLNIVQSMTLNQLYRSGTKLEDVPPLFRGMRLKEWQRLQIQAQCEAYKGVPDGTPGTKWRGKSTSHRDNYGWRSI